MWQNRKYIPQNAGFWKRNCLACVVSFYLLQMKYSKLIAESKALWHKNPQYIEGAISLQIFNLGARWMFEQLNKNDGKKTFTDLPNYFIYGIIKYGTCLLALCISFFLLLKTNPLLTPLSIIIFYLFEIHFLFLFPLLIDGVEKPIIISIQQTYKIGLFTALTTIIPIGCFMMIGLFNFKKPFRNWYIGCLAIIIWYKNEVRNRI